MTGSLLWRVSFYDLRLFPSSKQIHLPWLWLSGVPLWSAYGEPAAVDGHCIAKAIPHAKPMDICVTVAGIADAHSSDRSRATLAQAKDMNGPVSLNRSSEAVIPGCPNVE